MRRPGSITATVGPEASAARPGCRFGCCRRGRGWNCFIHVEKTPKNVPVVPEIKLRQLTVNATENPVTSGAISPDGKYLAYIDRRGLQLKSIDTASRRYPIPAIRPGWTERFAEHFPLGYTPVKRE